jgi:chemotaxis protein CheX
METELGIYIKDFAETIIRVTHEVFSTMLGIELEGERIEPLSSNLAMPEAGIIAMLGVAGPISGCVNIRISADLSCDLASRLLMSEFSKVDEDVLDAIAEVGNMVVGGFKTTLEERFGPMGLSLPTVISAERYIARSPALGQRFTVSFQCPHNGTLEQFSIHASMIGDCWNNTHLRGQAEWHRNVV